MNQDVEEKTKLITYKSLHHWDRLFDLVLSFFYLYFSIITTPWQGGAGPGQNGTSSLAPQGWGNAYQQWNQGHPNDPSEYSFHD